MQTVDVALIRNGVVVNIIVTDPSDTAFRKLIEAENDAVVDLPSLDEHNDPNNPVRRPGPGWTYNARTKTKFAEPKPPELPPVDEQLDAALADDPEFVALAADDKALLGRFAARVAEARITEPDTE